MAINYVVSYTFSPSTTISSSQVNTNFSDNANTWTGLEAGTKTIAQIKVDADPTLALQLGTKQYIDHYSTWRKPVLQYNSTTVVNIETGINGTSGQAQILFPDGNLRTDSTTARINCTLTQVAALSGAAQSGLRTGALANQSWYAIFAVKVSDNSSNFVAVADTLLPIQANYSTLNSNYGTNSWVYLGLIRAGDSTSTNQGIILKFVQAGNTTMFYNVVPAAAYFSNFRKGTGIAAFATASATTAATWTYSAGVSGTVLPNNISHALWECRASSSAAEHQVGDGTFAAGTGTSIVFQILTRSVSIGVQQRIWLPASIGVGIGNDGSASTNYDISCAGFIDGALGVGSNPLL